MLSSETNVGPYKTTVEIHQLDYHDTNQVTLYKIMAAWYDGNMEVFLFTRNAEIFWIESDGWTIAY